MADPNQAKSTEEQRLEGIAASRGVCVGRALVLGAQTAKPARTTIGEDDVPAELERLEQALVETRSQLMAIRSRVSDAIGPGDAGIFDAHLLVLDDPTMLEHVINLIESEQVTADYAFDTVAGRYADTLAALEDEYLSERVSDLRDVATRVVNNLGSGHVELDLGQLSEPHVIISHDLAPSTTAMLDRSKVLGFAIDTGGKTSHAAILARSLRLPAVVGMKDASRLVQTGQMILLDGYTGKVIVDPSEQTLYEYGQLEKRQKKFDASLLDIQSLAAKTIDGVRVSISANLEAAGDAERVVDAGAEGVGLFRTEYLFLNRKTLPTEEEQFEDYVRAARALKPHPVVFRTLDIGGDKFPECYRMDVNGAETNPFLGWRGIRFCLEEGSLFRTQLRAILRASGVENNIRLMYPMISGAEELDQSNERLAACKRELDQEGVAYDHGLKIGTMIEVPSAVMIGDVLAKRCDFFSIGTNDLIQYALAADRMNEKVAYLYDPAHPAIIRLIKMTVDAGHRNGIHVAVCGEMASDPVMVPILLGLGVDELSVSPPLVAPVKYLVRRLKMSEARDLALGALSSESSGEVLARAQELAHCVAPELFNRS